MAATYVPGRSNRDRVRLLITDVQRGDPYNPQTVTDPLFQDEDLDDLLLFEGGDVRMAAAQALDIVASNEVLVLKVQEQQGLRTDGAKVASALHARAEGLRNQAASADVAAFDWAGPIPAGRAY